MAFRTLVSFGLGAAWLLACDPAQPEATGECAVDEGTTARFSVDVGAWPAEGDQLVIAASCTVAAVGTKVALECDDGGTPRAVTLTLSVTPELPTPLAVGDSVDFALRRPVEAAADRGYWSVRGADGALLLAGARSYSSAPSSDSQFFAPLTVTLDLDACDERKTDSCRLEQRVVLEVGDGTTTTRVPHGAAATLHTGHEMRVGRAMLSMSSGDPKVCPLDETTPETYEFVIAAAGE